LGNTGLVRAPLYVGLGVIAVAVLFVLLVSDSDESEVEFDVMNATFDVGCRSSLKPGYDFDDINPLTFTDGVWRGPTPYETYLDTRYVSLGEPVVANVVEESPGPEVVVGLSCSAGNYAFGGEVHVFAGNSREARRLGGPVPGGIDDVREYMRLSSGYVVEGSISTRVWETLDTDAGCCPSKYVIVKRKWKDGNWVETEREVWERTVYDWR
jgi:hypothetical protein